MRCIICHSDTTPLEILAMHTRYKKGFIEYHKFNGIIAMKKHIEFDQCVLLNNLLEDPTNLPPRSPLNYEPNKRGHMYLFLQFLLSFYY